MRWGRRQAGRHANTAILVVLRRVLRGVLRHHFHAAATAAHQLYGRRRQQRLGHDQPQGQDKPCQHMAGEFAGVSQGGHGFRGDRCLSMNQSNLGRRFSLSEATPSRTSGPPKPMNSSASEVSKEGPAWRNQLFSEYLVQRIAV